MKKSLKYSLLTILIIMLTTWLIRMMDWVPWWGFIIPVMALGIVIRMRRWEVPAFGTGFIAGFLLWFGASLYFSITLNDIISAKIGILLSVPKIIVFLISGVISGILTGLALYTGKCLLTYQDNPGLD